MSAKKSRQHSAAAPTRDHSPGRPLASARTKPGAHPDRAIGRGETEPSAVLADVAVLGAVFEATDAMLVYLDRDFNFVAVNSAYAATCQLPPEEMIGRNHFTLYPHTENETIFRQVRDTGQSVFFRDKPFEFPDQPERGVTYWDWSLVPVKDPGGFVRGLVFSLRETTQRKRTQQALQESEKDFRGMFQQTSVGMAQADCATLRFLRVNPAFCTITGYSEAELLGMPFLDLLADDRQIEEEAYARLLRGMTTGYEREKQYRRKDGSLIWVYVSLAVIRDEAGRPTRTAAVVEDISRRKRVEDDLRSACESAERTVQIRTARLQEMVAELEHFSYTITHDMRAPLRAMRGFAEVVEEMAADMPNPEFLNFLHRITTAAERMDLLITDALSYSKAVRQDLPLGPVNTEALLQGMLESYPEFLAHSSHIEVRLPLPAVRGNEAGLTQCFSNLLGNALKFTAPGKPPHVRVRAERFERARHPDRALAGIAGAPEPWVRLWVEDHGIGIPPAVLPHIFDMFSRGTTAYDGTGIGLALVRKVVQRMEGNVGVESVLGQGSRFWIELPAARA